MTNSRIINRFSNGAIAEQYLRRTYFRALGLSFRKIRKDKKGKKPDGYILDVSGKKVALAEIKLIKFQERMAGEAYINTIDETIQRAIRSARTQLRAIDTDLPKIIYLIQDDSFFNKTSLPLALFGKFITVISHEGITIFNGYSGFHPQYKKNNKFRDGLISAVICYLTTQNGYKLWVYRNKGAKSIPPKLLDRRHIEELWNYNDSSLEKAICSGQQKK